MNPFAKGASLFSSISCAVLLTGCATAPQDLKTPSNVQCIAVAEPLEFKDKYGLLDVEWEARLSPGVYISEKEDDEGTYFRAPAGGVYVGRTDSRDKPAGILTHMVYDGGIWLPHDPARTPRIYNYFALENAAVVPQPEGIDCGSVAYAKDPATSRLSIVAGSLAGAAGGVVGRAVVHNAPVSYGQAAAGGAIGGAIVVALINRDIGKIVPGIELKNKEFIDRLRHLRAQAVPLKAAAPGVPDAPR